MSEPLIRKFNTVPKTVTVDGVLYVFTYWEEDGIPWLTYTLPDELVDGEAA